MFTFIFTVFKQNACFFQSCIKQVSSNRITKNSSHSIRSVLRCKLFYFNISISYLEEKSYLSHFSRSEALLVVQSLVACHPSSHTRLIRSVCISNEGRKRYCKNSVKVLQKASKVKYLESGHFCC